MRDENGNYRGPNGETYWGEPITDDEKELVGKTQTRALFQQITKISLG